MINLKNCTIIAIDCIQPEIAAKSLEKSQSLVNARKVILFSDKKPFNLNENFEYQQIETLTDLNAYSKFVMNVLPNFIETEFCLCVQHDGYVVREDLWDEEYLNYDYIGAPWREDLVFVTQGRRVGNGGVSLRSKRLMDFCKNLPCEGHEDVEICVRHKSLLESNGFKFAPIELASKFSVEQFCDDIKYTAGDSFAFHGKHSTNHTKYIKDLFFEFYKEDLIKMDQERLLNFLRNEIGVSDPGYFGANFKGNLEVQQIPEEYQQFLFFLKQSSIKTYLELGVANGGSFFTNSIFLQKTAMQLHCVDCLAYKEAPSVLQTEEKILKKVDTLKKLFPKKEFNFFNSTTDNFFLSVKQKYDCIFIDADHSYEGVMKDYINSLKCVNSGGYLIFHDINNVDTGVSKCWNEVSKNHLIISEFKHPYNKGCGIGILKV